MGLRHLGRGLAAAALVLATAAASGDAKEAYKLGVEAIEAGRWADAARFFRAAIAERPEEKVRRFPKTEYLPHYYLGVALAEQGDCRAALPAWEQSQRQAQVEKSNHAGDLARRRDLCRTRLRRVDAAVAEVEELLARIETAQSSLADLARTPELAPLWDRGEPSFSARQQAAAQRLAEARRDLEEGGAAADLARLESAKSLAARALSDFRATTGAARERLKELGAATASALAKLESAEQDGRRALRTIQDLAPFPKKLARSAAALQSLLREILATKAEAGAPVLAELTAELDAAIAALDRAARRPPAPLADAAEAFLNGAYERALGLLEDESLAADERAWPHVCLLRAASRHALWALGGEADGTLIELAAMDLAGCADGEPLAPSSRFFSPRFVEFHDATRRALADEPQAAPTAIDAPGADPGADPADGR